MRYSSTIVITALLYTQTAFSFDNSNFQYTSMNENNLNDFIVESSDLKLTTTNLAHLESKSDNFSSKEQTHLPRYLVTSTTKDWDYLVNQTYTILGLSVTTVALMTLLPESVTNWTAEDRDFSNLANKWWDNVSEGPVWDKDDHYLNYIMHPYFGGVYYTAARHAGYDKFDSFFYSFMMSTFFWEYGVESFAEVPSIQDIIVTPLFGAVVGEWMYATEQNIVAKNKRVLGSSVLGNISLFLLNPVGHIEYWVTGLWDKDRTNVNLSTNPWFDDPKAMKFAIDSGADLNEQFYGINVNIKF